MFKKVFSNKWLRAGVAAAAFAIIFSFTDTKELLLALSHLNFEMIIWLMSISFLLVYVSALKWSYFLAVQSNTVSVVRLFLYYLLGYFVNLLFPSYIGGDVVRSLYAGGHGSKTKAFVATVLERYTGFIAMMAMAVTFIWFSAAITLQMRLLVIAMTLNLFFMTWLATTPRMSGWLKRVRVPVKVILQAENFQIALRFAAQHKLIFMKALLLSLFFHLCAVLNTVAAAHAVGWTTVPLVDLFIVLPVILLVGAVPVSPNGLGIQEGAYVYFLTGLGATPEQAFGLALILRAKVYVLALLGGIVWFFLRDSQVAASQPGQE
jgi:glycosyltransferase 2 family protein